MVLLTSVTDTETFNSLDLPFWSVYSRKRRRILCAQRQNLLVLLKRGLPLACGPPDFIGTQLYEASRFKCHCDQVAREIQAQSWHFETVCIVCSFFHVVVFYSVSSCEISLFRCWLKFSSNQWSGHHIHKTWYNLSLLHKDLFYPPLVPSSEHKLAHPKYSWQNHCPVIIEAKRQVGRPQELWCCVWWSLQLR